MPHASIIGLHPSVPDHAWLTADDKKPPVAHATTTSRISTTNQYFIVQGLITVVLEMTKLKSHQENWQWSRLFILTTKLSEPTPVTCTVPLWPSQLPTLLSGAHPPVDTRVSTRNTRLPCRAILNFYTSCRTINFVAVLIAVVFLVVIHGPYKIKSIDSQLMRIKNQNALDYFANYKILLRTNHCG